MCLCVCRWQKYWYFASDVSDIHMYFFQRSCWSWFQNPSSRFFLTLSEFLNCDQLRLFRSHSHQTQTQTTTSFKSQLCLRCRLSDCGATRGYWIFETSARVNYRQRGQQILKMQCGPVSTNVRNYLMNLRLLGVSRTHRIPEQRFRLFANKYFKNSVCITLEKLLFLQESI